MPSPSVPPSTTAAMPVPSVPPLHPGQQFDKYTLLTKLATGGMAEIFVARLTGAAGFQKHVVIKRILPHVAHDEDFIRMFLDEATTTARITHPNVCQVFELCELDGAHFLVLEYLEGISVADLLRRIQTSDRQLDIRMAAGIVCQACDGLHAAHEQVDDLGRPAGIVHRDVSPGNLFVTVDGIVKVLDFGIAKARWVSRKTRTGTLLGKCEYMSPEQARGGIQLDRRSDIFSLGILLYELLVGKRLFRRRNDYETLRAVLRAPIEPPRQLRATIPATLEEAIMRALERDRDDRHRSAYDFRRAISESVAHLGGPMPLCDLGPLVRTSFEAELRAPREQLAKAIAALPGERADTHHARPKLIVMPPPLPDEPVSDILTGSRLRLDRAPSEEAVTDEHTVRVLPDRPPSRAPRGTAAPPPNLVTDTPRPESLRPPAVTPGLPPVAEGRPTPPERPAKGRRSPLPPIPKRPAVTAGPPIPPARPADPAPTGDRRPQGAPTVSPAELHRRAQILPAEPMPSTSISGPGPGQPGRPSRLPDDADPLRQRVDSTEIVGRARARRADARASTRRWALVGLISVAAASIFGVLLFGLASGSSAGDVPPATAAKPTAAKTPEPAPEPAAAPLTAEEAEMVVTRLETADDEPADDPESAQERGEGGADSPTSAPLHEPVASEKAEDEGFLTITSGTPAKLWIERDRIGETPLRKHSLEPGEYKIKAETATGKRRYFRVDIESGETRGVHLKNWDRH